MNSHDAYTELETRVLQMILAGGLPELEVLRDQFAGSHPVSRRFTGVGFFTNIWTPEGRPKLEPRSCVLNDVLGSLPGMQAPIDFLLFIRDGVMTMLEGFTYADPWPANAEAMTLAYHKGESAHIAQVKADLLKGH